MPGYWDRTNERHLQEKGRVRHVSPKTSNKPWFLFQCCMHSNIRLVSKMLIGGRSQCVKTKEDREWFYRSKPAWQCLERSVDYYKVYSWDCSHCPGATANMTGQYTERQPEKKWLTVLIYKINFTNYLHINLKKFSIPMLTDRKVKTQCTNGVFWICLTAPVTPERPKKEMKSHH